MLQGGSKDGWDYRGSVVLQSKDHYACRMLHRVVPYNHLPSCRYRIVQACTGAVGRKKNYLLKKKKKWYILRTVVGQPQINTE